MHIVYTLISTCSVHARTPHFPTALEHPCKDLVAAVDQLDLVGHVKVDCGINFVLFQSISKQNETFRSTSAEWIDTRPRS